MTIDKLTAEREAAMRNYAASIDARWPEASPSEDAFSELLSAHDYWRNEATTMAADQCHAGYAGEHGDHQCHEIDRLRALAASEYKRGVREAAGRCQEMASGWEIFPGDRQLARAARNVETAILSLLPAPEGKSDG